MPTTRRSAVLLALTLLLIATTGSAANAQTAVPAAPGPAVVLTGSGWGHGVGMSQYGARAMAQQGRTATQILQHYYPGTDVAADTRVPDSREVRVDLFRDRPGIEGSRQVRLRSISATSATATPASLATVELGSGVVRPLPTGGSWWVTHDPAGGRYVLHEGVAGGSREAASGPGPVRVRPGTDSAVKIDNLASSSSPYNGTYRYGVLTITGSGSGALNPVLAQPLQTYLWGIAEVPASWEPAVLRAQAVVARTYAGRQSGTFGSTPRHQNYAGYLHEVSGGAAWKQAVNDTGGLAVTYQGVLAETYYSSSHGLGRSEASEDSWAFGSRLPYLRSVDDPYSGATGNGNAHVTWTATASNAGLAELVGLAKISNVRIASRTAGGSPHALEVAGWTSAGERRTVTWTGGWSTGGRGAGARLRAALALTSGGTGGRLRSQQVSAITLAPFTDDEQSVHQFSISALAAAGITGGCSAGPAAYCPGDVVSRAQMASFLVRARGIALDTGPDRFSDVAASGPHRAAINALAREGLVAGYGDGSYRPGEPVSRAQMASFLRASFAYPSSAGPDRFDDIAGTGPHRAGINTLAARGITSGCSTAQYCPRGLVTREQMASFLARALGLGG
jgi:peptidoglycan hydrolase-like amidase